MKIKFVYSLCRFDLLVMITCISVVDDALQLGQCRGCKEVNTSARGVDGTEVYRIFLMEDVVKNSPITYIWI